MYNHFLDSERSDKAANGFNMCVFPCLFKQYIPVKMLQFLHTYKLSTFNIFWQTKEHKIVDPKNEKAGKKRLVFGFRKTEDFVWL